MGRWTQVKWTEAGQVTALLGWPPSDLDRQAPEVFFDGLRTQGRAFDAMMFLGQVLPRFEAVSWAARSVRDCAGPATAPADQDALKSALLWLQDPSDTRRRAALKAASAASQSSAQKMCALAVFFSGGSMAPENLQPVLAPKHATGKCAAGAVLKAALASGRQAQALEAAFELGDALASGRSTDQP